MDPTTLAAGAVTALVPYLTEAGKGLAFAAGEAAWVHVEKLWALVRGRIGDDAANDLVSQPGDDDVQGQARLQLRKALAADPAFARDLEALLPPAQTEVRQVFVNKGDNNTQIGANNSTVTINRP